MLRKCQTQTYIKKVYHLEIQNAHIKQLQMDTICEKWLYTSIREWGSSEPKRNIYNDAVTDSSHILLVRALKDKLLPGSCH